MHKAEIYWYSTFLRCRQYPELACHSPVFLALMLAFTCIAALPVFAQQQFTPSVLTLEDGLSSRDVRVITQDGRGLMWIGTSDGLNRYDGYRVLQFDRRKAGDMAPGNYQPDGLLTVSDSALLVVGDNQLYRINPHSLSSRAINGIEGQIWQIRRDPFGAIWLVSDNRSMQFLWKSTDGAIFEKVDSVPRLRREFTDLEIDNAGNIWWSTNLKGLRQYSNEGLQLQEFKADSFDWYGTRMYFTPIFIDSRDRIFLFPKSRRQLWQYFPADSRLEVVLDSLETLMYHAVEGQDGNIWFATKQAVYQLHADGEWTIDMQASSSVFDYTEIKALYEDRTHMLWIGTDGGLLRMPVRKKLFDHLLVHQTGGWGYSMRDIVEDRDGRIYSLVTSDDPGLFVYDPMTADHVKMQFLPQELNEMLTWANKMIYLPEQHAIWVYNNALLKISLASQSIRQVEIAVDNSAIGYNPISLLPGGHLIFGNTAEGLMTCDPESEIISALPVKGMEQDASAIRITCILPCPDGDIWLGTMEDGLYLIDSGGQVIGHWNTQTVPAIGNDHVLSLYFEAEARDLWIGTLGGGLDHLHLPDNRIRNFNKKEGLPDNKIVSILADGDNLWMGTYNGLSCFNRETLVFQNFFEEDGLSHHEFNFCSAFRDSQGRLYFGGMNGINAFYPGQVEQQGANPPLQLTGFWEFNHREGRTIERDPLRTGGPVVISPYVSYFQIEWTLPNYFHPQKNQYWTWLEGLEKDWSYMGSTPHIRFNGLAPGEYTLRIKGADSRGNPAATELAIPLIVRRIFYQRWWFLGLCAMVAGGIAIGIVRYRYRQKLEMEKVRTRIAGDLHDEVGSMLTGLAMQAELMEMQDASAGRSTLTYIKEVSRNAVSKMRDMTWSIDSGRDRVADLVDRMHEFANEVLTPVDIVYTIQTVGLRPSQELPVELRRHLYLIFKEAIANICKHSEASEVEITLGNIDRGFEMRIRDNGSGFSTDGTFTGLGLESMRRRAEALGGTCSVENADGCLVKVRLGKGV